MTEIQHCKKSLAIFINFGFMNEELIRHNEYIALHINEYLSDAKFFDIFEDEDVKEILEAGNLTIEDYLDLIEQSLTSDRKYGLLFYLLNAITSIKNIHDANLIVKVFANHFNLRILNSISNVLN